MANPFSYLNPFVWTIFKRQNPLQEIAIKAKTSFFEHKLGQRIELENFKKMYQVVQKPLPINKVAGSNPEDKELIRALTAASNALSFAFYERYQKNKHAIYHIRDIESYLENVFNPSLKKAATDCHVTVQDLPRSWYEQLKEEEARLSDKEKAKILNQEKIEEWRKTTKFQSVKETQRFFDNLRNSDAWKRHEQLENVNEILGQIDNLAKQLPQ